MNLSPLYHVSYSSTARVSPPTTGPCRKVTRAERNDARRYLIIVTRTPGELGQPAQVQVRK